jgi:hypothetical protein
VTIYRDDLERVRALIKDPRRWTKGFFARTHDGVGIEEDYDEESRDEGDTLSDVEAANHPDAACWCLYGAAYKCGIYKDKEYEAVLGIADIPEFNDAASTTHADVLAALTAAIERAPVRSAALSKPEKQS